MTRLTLLLTLVLGTAVPATPRADGPRAPAITSDRWFNSPPLRSADLRGRVVLVEFWTFECINCRRTLPALRRLHALYSGRDVVIIGVHTPELPIERDPAEVARAVKQLDVRWPVAFDPDYRIWNAFGNHYWPALYLVDRSGVIRWSHAGELHEGTSAWNELRAMLAELKAKPA